MSRRLHHGYQPGFRLHLKIGQTHAQFFHNIPIHYEMFEDLMYTINSIKCMMIGHDRIQRILMVRVNDREGKAFQIRHRVCVRRRRQHKTVHSEIRTMGRVHQDLGFGVQWEAIEANIRFKVGLSDFREIQSCVKGELAFLLH